MSMVLTFLHLDWENPEIVVIEFKSKKHQVYSGQYSGDLKEFELMQYTGLKDMNGKEIYEGDIVLFPDYETETVDVGIGVDMKVAETSVNNFAPVVFKCGCFGLNVTGKCETLKMGFNSFDYILREYGFEINELQIIGNIYENPELLEETL
jgi:uncharacterized phage protein (TIGR01671 family)